MRAEFAEQRDQHSLEKSFASTGELERGASGESGIGSRATGNLQPVKIEERKTDLQSGLRGKLEGGGEVFEKKFVGSRGNSVFLTDTAAAITEQEPANDGNSRGLAASEIGCDGVARLRKSGAGVAPGGAAEVAAVVQPGIIQ